jgi:hypothetical protein
VSRCVLVGDICYAFIKKCRGSITTVGRSSYSWSLQGAAQPGWGELFQPPGAFAVVASMAIRPRRPVKTKSGVATAVSRP